MFLHNKYQTLFKTFSSVSSSIPFFLRLEFPPGTLLGLLAGTVLVRRHQVILLVTTQATWRKMFERSLCVSDYLGNVNDG